MKKWLAFLLMLCLACGAASCADAAAPPAGETSTSGEEVILPDATHRFTGTVYQTSKETIDVYTEDAVMVQTSTYYTVRMPLGEDGKFFFVGDTVEVAFTGEITETMPAQIKGTVSVTLLKSAIKSKADTVFFDACVMSIDETARTVFVSVLDKEAYVNVSVRNFADKDFVVGDVLRIGYDPSTEDIASGELETPIEVRYLDRVHMDVRITAKVLEIAEDHIRIMGMDEGYMREWKLMTACGADFSVGESIRVSFSFRGTAPDRIPNVIKGASLCSLSSALPEIRTVWIHLTDVYATTGYAEAIFYMNYTFQDEWEPYAGHENCSCMISDHVRDRELYFPEEISLADFHAGDYAEISFLASGAFSETVDRYDCISIRRLNEDEIAKVYRKTFITGIYLGGNDREMAFDIGNGVYYIQKNKWTDQGENPPALTYGDTVQIVTDGVFFVGLRQK